MKGLLPGPLSGTDPTELAWFELHYAGRHGQVRQLRQLRQVQPSRPAAAAPASGAALLAIGLAGQLPVALLAAGLHACRADDKQHSEADQPNT